jgi:cystathionine beta-lyase
MNYDFDQLIDRRGSNCAKWQVYGDDVLPMWVADMDFRSPPAVIEALQQRVAHGFFGYAMPPAELSDVICARLQERYGWAVTPEQIVYLPSIVSGLNAVCRAIGAPGDGVLMQTPAYPPFLKSPENHQLVAQTVDLRLERHGQTISYQTDFDALEAAITDRTRLFMLCNPHNPIGVAYTRAELTRMAEICERHDLVISSDEIHCDLLLGDTRHTPTASLAPEIAERCITLMSPSKTYNLPGLGCGFAIVSNPELRRRLNAACEGIVPHVNALGLTAALAAFRDGEEWLAELRAYLTANRDALVAYVTEQLPQIRTTVPQATYLAWFDCREAGIGEKPYQYFLEGAKVALSDGVMFGANGQGFVRLNFGCPRSLLLEGLGRIRDTLERATLVTA